MSDLHIYIKNLLLIFLGILFVFGNSLKAENIKINHGWNLVGSSNAVELD